MTVGETINFWGSVMCLAGCLLFIGVYTWMPLRTGRERWWSSYIGRLLITKAAALAGLMLIVILMYLFDFDVEWIRSTRGIFAAVIAVMMVYQSWLVYHLQRDQEES